MCFPNIYNPAEIEYNDAAKLWELLRRSPNFREIVSEFITDYDVGLLRQKLVNRFRQIDETNPLAAFVLRWLFKPRWINFNRPRHPDNIQNPWTTEDVLGTGFDFAEETILELELMLKEEEDGQAYAGPLMISNNEFTLDTQWRHTPDLFRFYFSWLWSSFRLGRRLGALPESEANVFQMGEAYKPTIDWTFVDDPTKQIDSNTAYSLRKLRDLLEYHDLFAVPRMISLKQTEDLKKSFGYFVESLAERASVQVSVQKYANFLGAKNEWQTFAFCFERIHLNKESIGTAINHLIEAKISARQLSSNSNYETKATRDYEKMEAMMNAAFPIFDYSELVRIGLELSPSEELHNKTVFSKKLCTERLHAIHQFKETQDLFPRRIIC